MNETTKKPFDPSKPVQTRDGKPARIHATDLDGSFPILATYYDGNQWRTLRVSPRGKYLSYAEENLDLINVPPPKVKRDFWLAISKDGVIAYRSAQTANFYHQETSSNGWRTVKVTAEYEPFPCQVCSGSGCPNCQ